VLDGKNALWKRGIMPPVSMGNPDDRGFPSMVCNCVKNRRFVGCTGFLEAQFRNYFHRASQQSGRTGDALVKMLERRLDNVIYRLGFAPSRKSARQLVVHRHFVVNNQIVDVPSFLVSPGDVIQCGNMRRNFH